MDDFHERLARGRSGCCVPIRFRSGRRLCLQAHGILERPSEDVDLFATLPPNQPSPTRLQTRSLRTTTTGRGRWRATSNCSTVPDRCIPTWDTRSPQEVLDDFYRNTPLAAEKPTSPRPETPGSPPSATVKRHKSG